MLYVTLLTLCLLSVVSKEVSDTSLKIELIQAESRKELLHVQESAGKKQSIAFWVMPRSEEAGHIPGSDLRLHLVSDGYFYLGTNALFQYLTSNTWKCTNVCAKTCVL